MIDTAPVLPPPQAQVADSAAGVRPRDHILSQGSSGKAATAGHKNQGTKGLSRGHRGGGEARAPPPVRAAATRAVVTQHPQGLSRDGSKKRNNLKQPPLSLGSNTGGSGGATTLGSESEDNTNEVQQAITENALIWSTLHKHGVKACTAAALEQELSTAVALEQEQAALEREQAAAAIAGAPSAHAAVLHHVLNTKEQAEAHARARANYLERTIANKDVLIAKLRAELVAHYQQIQDRDEKISTLRAQVRHLQNSRTMPNFNLSDSDGSDSSENGEIQDGDSVSNSHNNNEDTT